MGFSDSLKTFAGAFAGGFNAAFPASGPAPAGDGGRQQLVSQVAAGLGAVTSVVAHKALNTTATTNSTPLRTEASPPPSAMLTNQPQPLPAPQPPPGTSWILDNRTILLVGGGLLLGLVLLARR